MKAERPVRLHDLRHGAVSQSCCRGGCESVRTLIAVASCTSDASPQIANGIDCVKSTAGMLQAVSAVQGAIGYAQIGDVATYRGGGIQAVAIDGLDGRYGDIGRTPDTYSFWTVEYLYTYGPAAGIAEAFLKYLGTPTAESDLEAAQYTPCPANGSGRPGKLCAQAVPDSRALVVPGGSDATGWTARAATM